MKNILIEKFYSDDVNKYIENIDINYSYKISKDLLKFKTNENLGYRTAGSKAELEAADFLYQEMKKIGLENVKKEQFTLDGWTFTKGQLKVEIDNKKYNFLLGGYQVNFDTEGEKDYKLLYVKKGRAIDYKNIDVKDKVVLIDINQKDEWWVNYPALQAYFKGAAAVLCVQEKGFSEVSEDALNANDIIGPDFAPILSITRRDANVLKKELEKFSEIKITLDVKSVVKKSTDSYNVTGSILGENKESYIILSSHYDAYFDGFQDNATAVGIMYGIAKAILDSGYRPKNTIIFTSLAAEEWGTSNTRYDWSTGAYNQVFKIHPEWQGRAILNINFELPAYLHNPFDEITASYELKTYLENFVNTVPQVEGAYTEDTRVITPLTTWADDWSFSIGGIPAVRNDFTSSNFRQSHYHTNYDNIDTYNSKVFEQHHILYGLLVINYDNLLVVPLDFSTLFNYLKNSLLRNEQYINKYKDLFVKNIDELIKKYRELFIKIDKINYVNNFLISNNIDNSNLIEKYKYNTHSILKDYRFCQDNLLRLNWEDEPIFPHEQLCENISNLEGALNYLKIGNKSKSLEKLMLVDNNELAYNFDKEVWNYFNNYVLNAEKEKLMWGGGRIVSHCDLYDIIHLIDKDSNDVEDKLLKKINEEKAKLDNELKKELDVLKILLDN